MTEQVQRRVLHWFARRRLLNPDDARGTLAWNNGGFSLDASVRIAGDDRVGLERLLRCRARLEFALERIERMLTHIGEISPSAGDRQDGGFLPVGPPCALAKSPAALAEALASAFLGWYRSAHSNHHAVGAPMPSRMSPFSPPCDRLYYR